MKKNLLFLLLLSVVGMLPAQTDKEVFLNSKVRMQFTKKQRTSSPPIKTIYTFDISGQTGREYLKAQTLYDAKGKLKSKGEFSDNGNKIKDYRYTVDASGKCTLLETKDLTTGVKVTTAFDASGNAVKKEWRTKNDSLIATATMIYDAKGSLVKMEKRAGEKLIHQFAGEYEYDKYGNKISVYEFEVDSTGQTIPAIPQLCIFEYDDQGMMLQYTRYKNKEKRKMLDYTYYKYQIDNDYRVIRQTGFNEEQMEVSAKEIVYMPDGVQAKLFKAEKGERKAVYAGAETWKYNEYGEVILKSYIDASDNVIKEISLTYDDFGHVIEEKIQEGERTIKLRTIYEYHTEQAAKSGK